MPRSHSFDRGDVDRSVTYLSATPGHFQRALESLGEARFSQQNRADQWSPLDILIHLRSADAILTTRIWTALVQPDSVFASMDERRYGDLLTRAGLSAAEHVAAFNLRRSELVGLLRSLSADEWETTVWRAPLWRLVTDLPDHEAEHLNQLEALLESIH